MTIIDALRAQADRVNAAELEARRDYHQYLAQKGDHEDTLEQHIAKYASLARFGTPAGDDDLARLQTLSQPTLPAPLLAFYRAVGSFHGGAYLQDLVLHAPARLLQAAALEPGGWEALPSIGLADMVRWSWGNDRFEFDPAQRGGLTPAEVGELNRRYSAVGWRVVEDGEGFEYLYFDGEGRFGGLFYHQDAFDELYEDDLLPMLAASPARAGFDEALAQLLQAATGPSFPD
jgi:hypothetical protein